MDKFADELGKHAKEIPQKVANVNVRYKKVWSQTILDEHGYAHFLKVAQDTNLKYLHYYAKKKKNRIEADDVKRLYNFYTCTVLWSICASFMKGYDHFYLLKNKCISVEPDIGPKRRWELKFNYPKAKDDYYMHVLICLNEASIRVFDVNKKKWIDKQLKVWPGDAIVMPNGAQLCGELGQTEYEKPLRFYLASYSTKENKYTTAMWKEPVHNGINNKKL